MNDKPTLLDRLTYLKTNLPHVLMHKEDDMLVGDILTDAITFISGAAAVARKE